MRKIYSILLLAICFWSNAQNMSAQSASWIGNSYIVINGTWYNGSSSSGTTLPSSIGNVVSLTLTGQIQSYGDNDGKTNPAVLCYKFDEGSTQEIKLNWFKYQDNNNWFGYESGSLSIIEGFNELTEGEHTLTMYFKKASSNSSANNGYLYDSNNSNNYKVKFTKMTSANITIGSTGYATFVTPCALDFDGTGVTAYTVSSTITENKVTMTSVTKVPANTAIVVKGTNGTHEIPAIASADDITTALTYSSEVTAYSSAVDRYYLGVDNGEVGFRKLAEGGSIAAGKCFFETTAGAKFLTMSFDDEVSGINTVENAQNNGVAYNLAGQRVNANAKGIVIINGKKYFNK